MEHNIRSEEKFTEGDTLKKGKYTILRSINGNFAQGKILVVMDNESKQERILKMVEKNLIDSEREVSNLKLINLKCDHVITYFDHFVFNAIKICIITEFCEGGDLQIKIKERKGKKFELELIKKWNNEILEGISFLHSYGIIHRDIKPGNIFLTADERIKIGDLGLSKIKDATDVCQQFSMPITTRFVGTCHYMSPELIDTEKYFETDENGRKSSHFSKKNDIWAYGCVLYELITLERLFDGPDDHVINTKILEQQILLPETDSTLFRIVQRCLVRSPNERANIEELNEINMNKYAFDSNQIVHRIKNEEEFTAGDTLKNEKYTVVRSIGNFGQSKILIVMDNKAQKERILKMVEKDSVDSEREIANLKLINLKCDHFITYFDHFTFNAIKICIITEFCEGGDLNKKIKEGEKFELELIKRWNKEILEGISFLHFNDIIHRDIKPSNIFLTADGKIKIGDLGLSKEKKSNSDLVTKSTRIVGTINYMSPELIDTERYANIDLNDRSSSLTFLKKVDIWAYGCVLYELITLKRLFEGPNDHLIQTKILDQQIVIPETDPNLLSIMQKCLVRDPKDRATIEVLLEINSQPVIPRRQEEEEYSDRPIIRSLSTRSGSMLVNEELFALNPQPLTPRRKEDGNNLDRLSVRSLSNRSGSMLVNASTHFFSGFRPRIRRNPTMNPIDNLYKVVRQRSYEYIKCKKEIDAHNNSILCMKLMKKRRRITSESNVDYGGLQQLVTGSRDGFMKIWDLNSFDRKCKTKLKAHEGGVWCLERISESNANNNLLMSGGGDRKMRLWDLKTSQLIRISQNHVNGVNCLRLVDSKYFVSCDNNSMRVFELSSWTCNKKIVSQNGPIWAVKVLKRSGQTFLLTATSLGYIEVYDPRNLDSCVRSFRAHNDGITCLRIFPDGSKIATGGKDKKVKIWGIDNETCSDIFEGHSYEISFLKVFTNGDIMSSCCGEEDIMIWNMGKEKYAHKFIAHQKATLCALKTASGQLVTGGEDRFIKMWNYFDI